MMKTIKKQRITLLLTTISILVSCASNSNKGSFFSSNNENHSHTHQQAPEFLTQPYTENLRSLFDTDKATLRASAKSKLDTLLDNLEQASNAGILNAQNPLTIVGHTDSRASKSYNQKLSIRRAQSVANYLIKNGVPANFITVSGKGENQPIASNKTKAGRQLNRRVVVNVFGDAINIVEN